MIRKIKFYYNFNRFSYITKENEDIVGIITLFSYYSEITINSLVVKENYRNKGIGSKLIKKSRRIL